MRELIIRLKEKTKAPDFSMRGFKHMSEILLEETKENFDPRFLKYNLYEGKSKSEPREARLDLIAIYLGHKSYRDFRTSLSEDVDPVLMSIVGVYYSYVRMNQGKGKILRSPVQIL